MKGIETKNSALEFLLVICLILVFFAFASINLLQLFVTYELMVLILTILIYLTLVSLYRVRTTFYLFVVGLIGW